MKRVLIIGVLALFSIQIAFGQAKQYIQKYKPLCDSLSVEYGIPSNVILGVAMIESGNGIGRAAKLLNNHFGIVGKNNLRQTHGIKTRYRQYDTDTESFASFCRLMTTKKFYSKLKGNTNVALWLKAIGRTGYCRHPNQWSRTIQKQLRKYGL